MNQGARMAQSAPSNVRHLGHERRTRAFMQFGLDAVSWAVGIISAEVLRYEFDYERVWWPSVLVAVAATAAVQFGIGWLYHLYRGRYSYGSFEEVRALTAVVIVTALI